MTRGLVARLMPALMLGAALLSFGVDAAAQGRGGDRDGDYAGRPNSRYEDARRGQQERSGQRRRMEPVPVVPMPIPGAGWRRGQYLPPAYRGYYVPDLGRYRLRAPPPGYDWVEVGPDVYLVQRNSGLVLEAVPGGY